MSLLVLYNPLIHKRSPKGGCYSTSNNLSCSPDISISCVCEQKLKFPLLLLLVIPQPYNDKKEEIWLSSMTKAPTSTEKSKKQHDNKNTPPQTDYTTIADLGRSVGVIAVTPLVRLNRLTSAQHSH